MDTIPKFIFKYKGISSKEDLVRLLDIVIHHRIYMPQYNELNDPLEGQIISIYGDGYAGISIPHVVDKEDPYLESNRCKYRLLSFSSEYNTPQLWAHYANGYEGVCLCFSTDGCFRDIEPLEYCDNREDVYALSERKIDREIRRSFLKKNTGWSYEKEWRLIRKNRRPYMGFGENELKGIILGHNLSKEVKKFIQENITPEIVIMKTDIGYRTFQINILANNYEYVLDGTPLKTLDVEKTLSRGRYIYKKNSIELIPSKE